MKKTYKGIVKERTNEKNIFIIVVCAVLAYLCYNTEQYVYLPVIAVLIISVFAGKEHIVNEKGVNIRRGIKGHMSDSWWTWDEIQAIQPDYIKFKPNAQLTFERNSMLRPMLFTKRECEEIIQLAEEMNPEIYVDFYSEEEQREIESENARIKSEQAREREKARKELRKKSAKKFRIK